MMTPKEILIPLAILLLQICVIKWIDVKIKFAKSEEEAMSAIRTAVFRYVGTLSSWSAIGYVIYGAVRSAPISRLEVVIISAMIASVAVQVVLRITGRIIGALEGQAENMHIAVGTLDKMHQVLERHDSEIDDLKKKSLTNALQTNAGAAPRRG